MHIAHAYTYPAPHHAIRTSHLACIITVSSIHALQLEHFPGVLRTPIL